MRRIPKRPRLGRRGPRYAARVGPARAVRGFTLAELLVAMVIATMAAAVVARSLAFSLQFYSARTGETEAQLLCETVSLLVQDDITRKSPAAVNSTTYAPTNGKAPTLSGIALPDSCYGPNGNMTRQVNKIDVVSVEGNSTDFTVTIRVSCGTGAEASNTFTVTALG